MNWESFGNSRLWSFREGSQYKGGAGESHMALCWWAEITVRDFFNLHELATKKRKAGLAQCIIRSQGKPFADDPFQKEQPVKGQEPVDIVHVKQEIMFQYTLQGGLIVIFGSCYDIHLVYKGNLGIWNNT